MLKAIQRFFRERNSAETARKRLGVVLMHDRLDISPDLLEALKNDIIEVLSRYMEIDRNSIRVDFEEGKEYTALVSNVQVKRVYRNVAAT
ncbi:cell division topological specificity factor MinE [Desulfacinum infernum DSM 9756]|jgi:cell division topological specificity factor|uniref:Cell division topological specificity factor n=1 Tax=Desulfacinum infernum DSM 9756 TaxID=1121391 RepID=A0A1M5ABA2_9BACT|nr:cell division topological specificity factor MinE [Desulfacinum infernum]MBC7359426.1 cell division topological specificity factor MinE [Desulfacinum sp.]MBZ4659371.1 minE [Desulfacinum sp.]SHF27387.1 cell division topological specificity factor MinE [Desulfacinum infernum DSM 9756]